MLRIVPAPQGRFATEVLDVRRGREVARRQARWRSRPVSGRDALRIAVIAPPWLPVPPPAYGGTELVLDGLCRGLVAAGHEVLLFTTGDSTCPVQRAFAFAGAWGPEAVHPGVELRHVIAAYEAAVEWGADIVHDHTVAGPVHASRVRAPAIVTTNHGPFDDILAPVYRSIADRIAVVAISAHQAATAPMLVARVIHHGLDVERYPFGAAPGAYALFLGRMSPDKGVHVAARVARQAGVPLRIAAKMRDQAERAYFEAHVEPLLGGDVEYLGEVGGDEKLRLLAGASCLLNPIAWPEPFGMVMVEALACGTPVVATRSGAAPEIVDDGVTGFLVNDERALGRALLRVPELDRRTCRAAAAARFSSARMAGDHVALYRDLLAGRRGGDVQERAGA